MAIEVKIPDLGDGVDSGDVLEVFVTEGQTVTEGQDLIELETDKATVMVPSSAGGKISKVHVAAGDSVSPGSVIVTVELVAAKAKQSVADVAAGAVAKTPAAAGATEADQSTPSKHQHLEAALTVSSKPAERIGTSAEKSLPEIQSAQHALRSSTKGGQIAAGPAMRRLAREVGIDIATVAGTGAFGRITRDDLMKAVRGGTAKKNDSAQSYAGPADDYGPIRIEKLSKIRQTIARKMHESWVSVPRVTNFDDADITELEHIRENSKKDYAARNIKLTTMPFVIKAVAMSLKSHPIVNASIDMERNQVVYKDYVNIGVAIDTERGLVVPAMRKVNGLAIPEIARQLSELAENIRNNDFSVDDLRGGTFTISNLGAIGGTYSTPIVNVPETAILLVGRSRKIPVVVNDQIKIRLMMPLSLSYDHRLIDGATAARFLNEVKGYLEVPSRLLLAL
jgi:pyruvate/2-oxoglutarate dehydrogenase complex dihydrolipoamide acyltransferase (E2) component